MLFSARFCLKLPPGRAAATAALAAALVVAGVAPAAAQQGWGAASSAPGAAPAGSDAAKGLHGTTKPLPAPASLTPVLHGIEKKYNNMKSMKVRFVQIFRQGGQLLRREQGTLYLSKPGRMRWEYEAPESKLFVSDGKRLTLYVPSEHRVTEMAVKESDDLRAPLAFLLGRLDFAEQFGRYESSADLKPLEAGNVVFKAYPKKLGERLESVLFEVSPQSQIRRLVVTEMGGNQTEFRFDGEQPNPALAQNLFQFTPPSGAQVVRE